MLWAKGGHSMGLQLLLPSWFYVLVDSCQQDKKLQFDTALSRV